jgi:hypothetical protein
MGLGQVARSSGRWVRRRARARAWSPDARGGTAGAGSLAADSGHSLHVEQWCHEGVASGMVTENGAHRRGSSTVRRLGGGEAVALQRRGAPTATRGAHAAPCKREGHEGWLQLMKHQAMAALTMEG